MDSMASNLSCYLYQSPSPTTTTTTTPPPPSSSHYHPRPFLLPTRRRRHVSSCWTTTTSLRLPCLLHVTPPLPASSKFRRLHHHHHSSYNNNVELISTCSCCRCCYSYNGVTYKDDDDDDDERCARYGLHHHDMKFNVKYGGAAGKAVFGFLAAASAFFSLHSHPPPALAESITVAFPVSRAREVNTVQRTLVEAWGLIRETFVDPTFNHQDWDSKLQQTMVEIFPLRSADAAYGKISGMLTTLGDPFTRIISPKEYQNFRIGSDGNLQGVGLFISVEPSSGHLVVLSCIDGSPAARAGIHEGDELVEIDGVKLEGVGSEAAAQKLRGRVGTTVTVKLHSGSVSGTSSALREVMLPREVVRISPLSCSVISHFTADGHEVKTGYVRLAAFSQTAAVEMENAIQDMENQGVQSYILDLRNNPGGLVKAGLDVAQIWLDGNETLVNTIDRDGNMLPINLIDGHALTHDPLVVLVNEGSASASEILAGALHDNGRATLVGHKTFGKGKIQSVTELHDGSALFITVAKYLSPALHDIDQVGIMPDVQCTPNALTSSSKHSESNVSSKRKNPPSNLEADSCILVAEHELEIQQSKGSAS